MPSNSSPNRLPIPGSPEAIALDKAVDLLRDGINAYKEFAIERERERTKRHELNKKAEVLTIALQNHHDAFLKYMYGQFGSRDRVIDHLGVLLQHPSVLADPDMVRMVTDKMVAILNGDPMKDFKYLGLENGLLLPAGE